MDDIDEIIANVSDAELIEASVAGRGAYEYASSTRSMMDAECERLARTLVKIQFEIQRRQASN